MGNSRRGLDSYIGCPPRHVDMTAKLYRRFRAARVINMATADTVVGHRVRGYTEFQSLPARKGLLDGCP
jgi:hypothetical protein